MTATLDQPLEVTPAKEQRCAELQQLALDHARLGGNAELAAMLRLGVSMNLKNHKGNTLLMLAAYHGNVETTRLLFTLGTRVDERNDRNQTSLGGVAFKGCAEVAALLIEADADVNADQGDGVTPLMLVARLFGHEEVARLLEKAGSRVKTCTKWKPSALHFGWLAKLLRPLVARA